MDSTDNISDAARLLDKADDVADTAKAADKATDAGKLVDNPEHMKTPEGVLGGPDGPPKLPEVVSSKAENVASSFQKKAIDDVENGKTKLEDYGEKKGNQKRKGNYGEMKMDQHFESIDKIDGRKAEFKRISNGRVTGVDQKIVKGIDGVYENSNPPPKFAIAEAKYETSTLNKKTGQMSDPWIEKNLDDAVGKDMADKIREEALFNSESVKSVLVHTDKAGNITTKVIDTTGKVGGVALKIL